MTISCQLRGTAVVIDLSHGDEVNVLYLNLAEAGNLLAHLEDDLVGSLFCEDFDPAADTIDVAGTVLPNNVAWRLLSTLETIFEPELGPNDLGSGISSVAGSHRDPSRVNWKKEGF